MNAERGVDRAALDYEAPYLIEKLLRERIVATAEEGRALFAEVKRYLVLSRLDGPTSWDMYSRRVDEVWHQFILFADEYARYCERFLGGHVVHSPSNAPRPPAPGDGSLPSTLEGFRRRYLELFGQPLPAIWYDENSVSVNRRVLNDGAGSQVVRVGGGTVELVDGDDRVILSANELAHEALSFVAGTGAFYVRELSGGLTDEEKIALAATLVRLGVLRVAP